MKVLTCASYRNTGSSAITDLISEYTTVHSLTNYEFRFVHDTDGIMDLEYNLVESHDRDNSNHAIKRFLRLSKFNSGKWFNKRYEPFFNDRYWELTEKYIDELINIKYRGHDFYDYYDRGIFFYYRKRLEDKILRRITNRKHGVLENELMYCAYPSEEKFLNCTKHYINSLLSEANSDNKPFIIVDQIVPSTNIKRCLRYFDDIVVVVVDRDPRDLYATAIRFNDQITPISSPEAFCEWFLNSRAEKANSSLDNERIVRIMFEDLIYNYSETVKMIEKLTGLDSKDHLNMFSMFNPKRSFYNTHVFDKYAEKADIEYIKTRLKDYLFDFDKYTKESVEGINVSDTSMFER